MTLITVIYILELFYTSHNRIVGKKFLWMCDGDFSIWNSGNLELPFDNTLV